MMLKMNARLRRSGLRAAVLLAAVAAVGMGSANAQELKPWRHGVVEAKSDAGFVFMAAKGGFGEKQGLKIEMIQFKGDALALRALLAGELDSYEGSPGGPLLAGTRGGDIKITGCYWPGLTYGIYSKPTLKSPADLKGKSIAISSPGALPDLLARAVLDKYNIPGSEVKFSAMGSDSDRFKAVTAGIVDVAAASTEFVPVAEKMGVKLLAHAHDVVPNYLRFCTMTSAKTIATRSDDLAKYLAASMNAWKFAMDNRDKVVALTNEVTGSKPDDARPGYVFDEVKKYSAIDPTMPIPMEKLAWMQELLIKTGNLPKAVDLKSLVDGGPRAKALAIVGK
jgi:NitT/TauT family transport system substrate-binding protein